MCIPPGFYSTTYLVTSAAYGAAVDCAGTAHDAETAFVGEFPAAVAAAATPPADGGTAQRAAFATCQRWASAYLGGDWRTASVWLSLVQPAIGAWGVGARWYRCDIGHLRDRWSR